MLSYDRALHALNVLPPSKAVLQELTHMVVDFVCGVLGLRPPERYERVVWLVLLSLLVILFVLALLLRR